MSEKTLGERRIRTDFNVSGNDLVAIIKKQSAELIDLLQAQRVALRTGDNHSIEEQLKADDKNRLISMAQTSIEEAAMWAVKAATA
jgi:hypothetical protein